MKVIVNATSIGLWQEIICEAEAACATPLKAELEYYLAAMLIRYMNKPEIAKEVMASRFLESIKHSPKQRQFALQQVGDTCLLFSGLFPGMAEKRLVKISYFVNLGRSAYANISSTSNDLYDLLTQEFVPLMDVLQSIRKHSTDYPELLPLQAYDLWQEANSQRALKVLKQYTNSQDICLIKGK
jgi:hypothetical protein